MSGETLDGGAFDGGSTAGAPTRVDHLAALPATGPLYAGALARAGRAMVATASVGEGLPDRALRVADVHLDRARLDAYCRLIGETAGEAAPPGFVHVTLFPLQLALMGRADFPLPMLGMVHVANRVEQLRAVRTDDALVATTWARDLVGRPVGSGDRLGTQVELVTEARVGRPDGELVWQGVSTYLAKGVQLPDLALLDRPERPAFSPPVPTGGWTTAKLTSREYATVSGDRNPIHTHALAARAFGFRGTIAHGMDTAARALAALGPLRGEAFTWTAEFAAPVPVPGRVALRLERAEDLDVTAGGVRPGWSMTAWDPRRGALHLRSALALA
ncbi:MULTISPECIES: MaoC/PaaZ C-terminal domain-containing protein [Miniimonas]|nr:MULTISPECIES: MaoC/PaaZ C-terminal domain-containing protein [Miniimonas]